MSDVFAGVNPGGVEPEAEQPMEPELTPEEIEIRRVNAEADEKRAAIHKTPEWIAAQELVFKHMHCADRATSQKDCDAALALKAEAIAARDKLTEGV